MKRPIAQPKGMPLDAWMRRDRRRKWLLRSTLLGLPLLLAVYALGSMPDWKQSIRWPIRVLAVHADGTMEVQHLAGHRRTVQLVGITEHSIDDEGVRWLRERLLHQTCIATPVGNRARFSDGQVSVYLSTESGTMVNEHLIRQRWASADADADHPVREWYVKLDRGMRR